MCLFVDFSNVSCQVAALQDAYDGLCIRAGTSAVPYFLIKYTEDTVHMAPLRDWETFFSDAQKVSRGFLYLYK